jgi:hypothetical protein
LPGFERFSESKPLIFEKLVSFLDSVASNRHRIASYFEMVSTGFDESCITCQLPFVSVFFS